MTDVALACGSEIIRIINDSLGIENRGRLTGEKETACSLYAQPEEGTGKDISLFTCVLFLSGFY